MPRISKPLKDARFNLRIDPALKAAFTASTEAEGKLAAQVVRDLMRGYVKQCERRAFTADARRQSREAAIAARDPRSDEFAVMQEMEAELSDPGFWAE